MTDDTEESVARNLTTVLNAKKGYSSVIEVYGLGAYDAHTATKELVDALVKEMTEAIRQFEPRLKWPQIKVLGRDGQLWVKMELLGDIDSRRAGFLISFHSVLRNVRVERLRDEHTSV